MTQKEKYSVKETALQYAEESWQLTGLERDTSPIAPLTPETFRARLESMTKANRDIHRLHMAMPHMKKTLADKST